ncbi:MAG: hypothetical protein ACRC62_39430 [Microcoleus sp.]
MRRGFSTPGRLAGMQEDFGGGNFGRNARSHLNLIKLDICKTSDRSQNV